MGAVSVIIVMMSAAEQDCGSIGTSSVCCRAANITGQFYGCLLNRAVAMRRHHMTAHCDWAYAASMQLLSTIEVVLRAYCVLVVLASLCNNL